MNLHLLNTEAKSRGTISPVVHVVITEQLHRTANASKLRWVPENPVIALEVMKSQLSESFAFCSLSSEMMLGNCINGFFPSMIHIRNWA